jgi:hypothetical protein
MRSDWYISRAKETLDEHAAAEEETHQAPHCGVFAE